MLELINICYKVSEAGREKVILNNVSLKLEDNVLAVITGQNGSGKSTLAKIIMGILQPTSGRIIYNGQDITSLSITERAKLGFTFAFQQPVTFKGITVKMMLDIARGKENTVSEACKVLSRVGLCARDYIDRELNSKLSGRELKRIELAMVIAKNGKVNICDEPEAGIDLWSFDALVNIFKEKNATNIIISHQSRIIEIADKLILLDGGSLIKEGSVKEVMPFIAREKCGALKEAENG